MQAVICTRCEQTAMYYLGETPVKGEQMKRADFRTLDGSVPTLGTLRVCGACGVPMATIMIKQLRVH